MNVPQQRKSPIWLSVPQTPDPSGTFVPDYRTPSRWLKLFYGELTPRGLLTNTDLAIASTFSVYTSAMNMTSYHQIADLVA